MKNICIGILAHVDAGKTTLSEALLYRAGAIRRLGRVDHQDAFLDTDAMERQRGITIFSKQAVLELGSVRVTLLDTPGHVDFSAEMERTLQVLDCAVLVISGTDGVQGHTRTLWELLERYHVPTFLFINKMDLAGTDRDALLAHLKEKLDGGCVDFGDSETLAEEAAVLDEAVLERYLETGEVSNAALSALIAERKLFPCYFGSALRVEGVDALLSGVERYAPRPVYPADFGAKVFKITRDSQGARLTHLKLTGGTLRVKDVLTGREGDTLWQEKADQLRLYSGAKFQSLDEAEAGAVVAVTGLSHTFPGQGLGAEPDWAGAVLQPVLTYRVELSDGTDPHTALQKLRQLEEEDPQLHLVWSGGDIHIQLMGEVQMEILQRLIRERLGMEVSFGAGTVCYRETIANAVEGIGHFEPLRHYAEVHLLLEPGEPGSGVTVASVCPTDELNLNWQRLILTHLLEKEHCGVLTGAPVTDIKLTLLTGRAHEKHTEGGDFRQATYRAVRQGLRKAESILLEPWYQFRLEVPTEYVGRAMTDLQRLSGTVAPPETDGEMSVLTGRAPVACLRDYPTEVTAYTQGRGRLICTLAGYDVCHNPEEVIASIGYDCDRDLENPCDSVFCAHGAGYVVPWNEVDGKKHLDSVLRLDRPAEGGAAPAPLRRYTYGGTLAEDKELAAIYERTYGKQEKERPRRPDARQEMQQAAVRQMQLTGPEYLLVDGYNIIFAWEELASLARTDFGAARLVLMDILANFQAFKKIELILVFDAYKVPNNPGSVEKYKGIHVVYTKEAETADAYIERVTYEIGKKHRVRVATSDGLEQMVILGHGALRISARAFKLEVEQAEGQISELIAENNRQGRDLNRLEHTARFTGTRPE